MAHDDEEPRPSGPDENAERTEPAKGADALAPRELPIDYASGERPGGAGRGSLGAGDELSDRRAIALGVGLVMFAVLACVTLAQESAEDRLHAWIALGVLVAIGAVVMGLRAHAAARERARVAAEARETDAAIAAMASKGPRRPAPPAAPIVVTLLAAVPASRRHELAERMALQDLRGHAVWRAARDVLVSPSDGARWVALGRSPAKGTDAPDALLERQLDALRARDRAERAAGLRDAPATRSEEGGAFVVFALVMVVRGAGTLPNYGTRPELEDALETVLPMGPSIVERHATAFVPTSEVRGLDEVTLRIAFPELRELPGA